MCTTQTFRPRCWLNDLTSNDVTNDATYITKGIDAKVTPGNANVLCKYNGIKTWLRLTNSLVPM